MSERSMSRRDVLRAGAAAAALPLLQTLPGAAQGTQVNMDPWHGLKVGVASYTFRKFPLEAAIKGIQRVDLHYVSIKDAHLPMNSTRDERKAVAQKFRAAGITPLSCGNVTMQN